MEFWTPQMSLDIIGVQEVLMDWGNGVKESQGTITP